jgi:hypothetical protein
MTTKTRLKLDTDRLNFRFTQYPVTVLDPMALFGDIVDQAIKDRAAIDNDRNLTPEGKTAARAAKRTALLKSIADVHTPRLAGLDGDIAAQRTALIPATGEKPDTRRIDFLLSHLRDRTPSEISIFYSSASDEERMALEEAARSVGRIPTKLADGSLAWTSLLPAETINASVIARATARNPQGAKKLQELQEIRDLHVSVATLAAAEVTTTFDG